MLQLQKIADNIFTIDNFWTAKACEDAIVKSETLGYEPATIDTEKGQLIVEEIRNNKRVIFKDFSLAEEIWSALKLLAPQKIGNSKVVGINELFRFYKYQVGQEFKKHRDQSFIRNEIEASYFTFMIYLNDDFGGGETLFSDILVKPQIGKALIFLHQLEHEGTAVTKGIKYVLRTDLMYKLEVGE